MKANPGKYHLPLMTPVKSQLEVKQLPVAKAKNFQELKLNITLTLNNIWNLFVKKQVIKLTLCQDSHHH